MWFIVWTFLVAGELGVNADAKEVPSKDSYTTLEECKTAAEAITGVRWPSRGAPDLLLVECKQRATQ